MSGDALGDERDLRIGGLRLHVRQVGDGSPVLLINGIGSHTGMWHPLERALSGHQVVSFDAPGAGRSQVPITALSMRSLAGLVEKLLDRLGHDSVDVVGYSFGGAVAQQLAHQAPGRVRRLVLVATTPGWGGVPGSAQAVLHILTPLRYWSPAYYEATIAATAGGQAHDPDFVRRHRGPRLATPPMPHGYLSQLMTLGTWSSLRWLKSIRHPALVVFGTDDPLTPSANGVLLAARLPRARLHLLDDEGHLLLLDDRGAAPDLVAEFLRASSVESSQAWITGRRVDAGDEAAATTQGSLTSQPWETMSALFRSIVA
jgi:poly(3-hydroxyoctanoate) depolymerase